MNSGEYTCFEVFAVSEKGKRGNVRLKAESGDTQTEKAGKNYYAWLRFTLQKDTDYEIILEDAKVSYCYLSGCDDILDRGIRFVEIGRVGESGIHPAAVMSKNDTAVHYDTCYREQYHFVPWKNWINDPNGLCWYQGRYHMFYQMNPHGQEWSNMYWGHAASRDLVHWIHLPMVLGPQEEILERPGEIKGGAFSGCAVPFDDKVVFYLTRHLGPMEDGPETIQEQWMSESRDMLHFEEEKLIIQNKPEGASFDFRDPKVTKVGDTWYMVLASALNGKAAILLYASADMEHWEYRNPLLVEEENGIRCFECPDFFEADGKYAALGAWMSHYDEQKRFQMSRYYIGDFVDEKLQVEHSGWLDFGSNFYAMQSFEHDGRRISIGWVNDPYGEHIEAENGAYGSMTIPREIHIKNNRLYMTPVSEIYSLKGEQIYKGEKPAVLGDIQGNSYYASVKFSKDTDFTILLGEDGDKRIILQKEGEKTSIRTTNVKSEGIDFRADVGEVKELEIFVDRRVVEIYINRGEAVGTKVFYNSSKKGCFTMTAREEAAVEMVEVTQMQSIW